MPVHDAMYTAAVAGQVIKGLPQDHPLVAELEEIQEEAFQASKLAAAASLKFFLLLRRTFDDEGETEEIKKLAYDTYFGPYHPEIA